MCSLSCVTYAEHSFGMQYNLKTMQARTACQHEHVSPCVARPGPGTALSTFLTPCNAPSAKYKPSQAMAAMQEGTG